MNKYQALQSFFLEASIWNFVFNLILAAILSFILSKVYEKYGRSLSNRSAMARNFVLLSMTTMLVITIVRSSLALSLGLIGALSIVRFRAAIKEPEELTFLFVAIAIGLGLGANQRFIVIAALIVIVVIMRLRSIFDEKQDPSSVYLTIQTHAPDKLSIDTVTSILAAHQIEYKIKRVNKTKNSIDLLILMHMIEDGAFGKIEIAIREKDSKVHVNLLDCIDGIGA